MMSFKQYFKNIWRNRDAYQRKPHGPPQGQGLCLMAHGLRWTGEEPRLRGYYEWESVPPRRRPERCGDPPRCRRRGKGPHLAGLRRDEGGEGEGRRSWLTQHPLRGLISSVKQTVAGMARSVTALSRRRPQDGSPGPCSPPTSVGASPY